MKIKSRDGSAMITVMIFSMMAAALAAMMLLSSGSQVRRSRALVQLEQAFFAAEGAAERAASYIAAGGAVPTTLRATIGGAATRAMILVESGGGMVGALSGSAAINPNHSGDAAFLAVRTDGSNIDQDDLTPGFADFTGPVSLVAMNPTGNGTQSSLMLNGTAYSMPNANTHTFSSNTSTGMTARIYNTQRNQQGQAVGEWRMQLTSSDASVGNDINPTPIRRDTTFTINSRGDVEDNRRSVTIRGLQTVSWAKYALWYNAESANLWIKGGEKFQGPVYSRPRFHFSNAEVSTRGQPEFFDRTSSAASGYDLSDPAPSPIFHKGINLNAPVETMATVNMAELRSQATLTLDGATTARVSNATVYITNARKGWNNQPQVLPNDSLIYVQNSTSGTTATKPGNLTMIGSTNGMRLTLAADGNININGHLRYKNNPTTNPNSTDAMGLIANSNVVVQQVAPNNLDVYAHIIARLGGFGVYKHDEGSWRGMLNVYGGIVNATRNAVGTTGGNGYSKNYIYDSRFKKTPPPRYPAVPDEFQWLGWEG
jgi:hypothetical protein